MMDDSCPKSPEGKKMKGGHPDRRRCSAAALHVNFEREKLSTKGGPKIHNPYVLHASHRLRSATVIHDDYVYN
jgi:hypothetical protein